MNLSRNNLIVQSMDQHMESASDDDQDDQIISTEVHPSVRTRQTDRAMTDDRARINFERTDSDSDRSFSFLVRMGRTASTDGRTDGLTNYFDPIFEFDHQEFSKAMILKLSDDLGHIWSSSVREKLHSGRTDHPAHVLVLTAAPNDSLFLVGPVSHIRQQIENRLFVGPVSHIRRQLDTGIIRRQLDTGISKAVPHPSEGDSIKCATIDYLRFGDFNPISFGLDLIIHTFTKISALRGTLKAICRKCGSSEEDGENTLPSNEVNVGLEASPSGRLFWETRAARFVLQQILQKLQTLITTASAARLSGMLLPMAFYMGVKGRLRVVISVFDIMPRDVRDQCAGFRARPRSSHGFRGAMTTSTYVFCIVFDLISSRFKVRDIFSAYVTCMVGIEHLFEDNF
ncbi:hypothetical protein DY000_02016474 [Brassica cretica]|uniref:Uncharacterized protein n=2 Tax=Brassica cretica TaxID=69181 RepID=A0ABQ7CWW6_BRACR|nr:hypothetical protein DY000_02016474 [Brassica cretica]